MLVSPFVEVYGPGPCLEAQYPNYIHFRTIRSIRRDWWRLAVPWPSPGLGAHDVCMIGGADLVGALGLGPGRRCPRSDRGRLGAWSWCPLRIGRQSAAKSARRPQTVTVSQPSLPTTPMGHRAVINRGDDPNAAGPSTIRRCRSTRPRRQRPSLAPCRGSRRSGSGRRLPTKFGPRSLRW